MKKIVLSESNCGGKRDREESQEVQELPVFPYRPEKFANLSGFFERYINNTPVRDNLRRNERLERSNSPTNLNIQETPRRDNSSEARTKKPNTKITKNYIAPNDDCDGTRFLPSSSQEPHQDKTLNNNPSRSLASEFSQQGNIPNCNKEKNESLPSSSTEVRSETPYKQLKFDNLTL